MRLVAAATLAALVGCAERGSNGITQAPDSTLSFAPENVTLRRYASICGVPDPAFTDDDFFSLSLVGNDDAGLPTFISVAFDPVFPLDQDLDVTLQPFGVVSTTISGGQTTTRLGQNGALPGGDAFSWVQGTDPGEIDATPLTGVTIRVTHVPTHEGEGGTLQLRMVFEDGGVYDVVVTAPVVTEMNGCPEG